MQLIDFLPRSYHEQLAARRAHRWRITVVGLYVALLLVGAFYPSRTSRRLASELNALRLQKQIADSQVKRLALLHDALKEEEAKSQLYTYLRHPWSCTRLLSPAFRELPEGVNLSHFELRTEQGEIKPQSSAAVPTPSPEAKTEQASSAVERDLAKLRKDCDSQRQIILLEGTASDPSLVHEYLGRLARCEFFSTVDLLSMESQRAATLPNASPDSVREQVSRAHFKARLVIRPGFGQPGGPTHGPDSELDATERAADSKQPAGSRQVAEIEQLGTPEQESERIAREQQIVISKHTAGDRP